MATVNERMAQLMVNGLTSKMSQLPVDKNLTSSSSSDISTPPTTPKIINNNSNNDINIIKQTPIPIQTNNKEKEELNHREKVILEICNTEKIYCKSLQTIVSDFLYPIQLDSSILKKPKTEIIFSNIEDIMKLHLPMLHDLDQCLKSSEKNIGEIFVKTTSYFSLYKSFCSTYAESLSCLADCTQSYPKFANFLADKSEKLDSLLIRPVQRIPRYRLLFAELLKHTDNNHPDYKSAQQALLKIEEVAIYVNESIREKENQDKLHQIQSSLTGSKIPTIPNPNRKFIREGVLVKMCRRTPKRRYFFLFSDLLIYTAINESKTSYAFHRALELNQVKVEDIPESDGMENAFQVLSNSKSFAVFAESKEIKQEWLKDIAFAKNFDNELRNSKSDDGTAPVWVPDKLVKKCMQCKSKFTTLNRRHHCRKCGDLVCGSCSAKKYKLPNIGKQCRVCDICYEVLTGNVESRKTADKNFSQEKKQDLAKFATSKFQGQKTSTRSTMSLNLAGKDVVYSSLVKDTEEKEEKEEQNEDVNVKRSANGSIIPPPPPRKRATVHATSDLHKPLPPKLQEYSDNFMAPPPPVNEDGFFEYDSEDDELPPLPPRLPPPPPEE